MAYSRGVTKKERAIELYAMLVRGPGTFGETPVDDLEVARAAYKLWSESWVLDELIDLIPELKKMGKDEVEKYICPACKGVFGHYPNCPRKSEIT